MAESSTRAAVILSAQKARNEVVTGSAVTLIMAALLIFGAVRPTMITINKIVSSNKLKKGIVEKLDTKINSLNKLSQEYNSGTKDDLEFLSYLYPAKGNFSFVMANIDAICERNGFYMSSINFGQPSKDIYFETKDYELLESWQVDFVVVGDQAQLFKLLSELEKMPIYPNITNLSFNQQKEKDGKQAFSINMIIYKVDNQTLYE